MKFFFLSIKKFFAHKQITPLLIILIFLIVSVLGINQYRYGWGDQSITVAFLNFFLNPSLYPHDYLLAQVPYYYTFLWFGLAAIIKFSGISTPIILFTVYLISIFFSFFSIYLIAKLLFKRKEVGYLSLFFLIFTNQIMAGTEAVNDMLLTITVALPLALFAIYFFLKNKYYTSYILQGICFLIHPLTALYPFAITVFSLLLDLRNIRIRRLVSYVGLFLLIISPLIVWKVISAPVSMNFLYADPAWISLLKLRSPHHIFPFSWGIGQLLKAIFISLVFIISCKYKPEADNHRKMMIFTVALVILGAVGVIFTEFIPLAIAMVLQFLRGFQFITYFAIIYFSNFLIKKFEGEFNIQERLLAIFCIIAFFYDTRDWNVAFFSLGAFLSVILFYLLAENVTRLVFKRPALSANQFVYAMVGLAIFLGASAGVVQKDFVIKNAQSKDWLDVQYWAKDHTDIKDVFIVPSNSDGFRVESQRSIYADWKDGTLMNFNPQFGFDWLERMKNLGYVPGEDLRVGFDKLSELDFIKIAQEMKRSNSSSNVFLVNNQDGKNLNFPVLYSNAGYKVYKIILK